MDQGQARRWYWLSWSNAVFICRWKLWSSWSNIPFFTYYVATHEFRFNHWRKGTHPGVLFPARVLVEFRRYVPKEFFFFWIITLVHFIIFIYLIS